MVGAVLVIRDLSWPPAEVCVVHGRVIDCADPQTWPGHPRHQAQGPGGAQHRALARPCPGAELGAGADVEQPAPASPALLPHVLGGQAAQALEALHVLSDELPVYPPVEPRYVPDLGHLPPVQADRGVGGAVDHQADVPQGVQGPSEHALHLAVFLRVARNVVNLTRAVQGTKIREMGIL